MKKNGQIGSGNSTYQKTSKTVADVVDDNVMYSQHLGLEVDEREKHLPTMYWIPKTRKDPPGARFIIASKHCATKKVCLECIQAYLKSD